MREFLHSKSLIGNLKRQDEQGYDKQAGGEIAYFG